MSGMCEKGLFADQAGLDDGFACTLGKVVCEEILCDLAVVELVSADGFGIARAETVNVDDVACDGEGCAGAGGESRRWRSASGARGVFNVSEVLDGESVATVWYS